MPTLKHLAPSNIDITTELYDQPVCVNLDAMLFERVLVNVVKNAVESIGATGGKIEIATDERSVRVTDNGHGIASENTDKLFTPFFSTKHQDRGLGLMLIADILRKHDFDFSLKTDAQTRLTSFVVTFPKSE